MNRRRATIAIVAGLVTISIPLAATSARIASTRSTEADVTAIAEHWAATQDGRSHR